MQTETKVARRKIHQTRLITAQAWEKTPPSHEEASELIYPFSQNQYFFAATHADLSGKAPDFNKSRRLRYAIADAEAFSSILINIKISNLFTLTGDSAAIG